MTKTAVDSSWEKELAWWYWKNWSMHWPEMHISMQNWQVMGPPGDAYHITSPCEDGSGAAKAMEYAMKEAGVKPEEVDYINAHGTSTHHNDLFETRAVKLAFGDAAKDLYINSTKSMIGHLLGAAGGVEFVTCVKSIEDSYIHQTVGTTETDPECDLNYTLGTPVEKELNCVMTNSLGFGGHNASLVLKKYRG